MAVKTLNTEAWDKLKAATDAYDLEDETRHYEALKPLSADILKEVARAFDGINSQYPMRTPTHLSITELSGDLASMVISGQPADVREACVDLMAAVLRLAVYGDSLIDPFRDAHGLGPISDRLCWCGVQTVADMQECNGPKCGHFNKPLDKEL